MDHFGSSMTAYGGGSNGDGGNDGNRRPNFSSSPDTSLGAQARPLIPIAADVKPRLTKEQHDILERHFQEHNKPSTTTKRGFAESLGVPLEKINNWFQNRRAKVKQDAKKQQMAQNMFATMSLPMHTQYPLSMHEQQPVAQGFPQDQFTLNQDVTQAGFATAPHTSGQDSEAYAARAHAYPEFSHSLHSIQESSQPVSRDGIVQNLAAAGYSMESFTTPDAFADCGQYLGLEQSRLSQGLVDGSGYLIQSSFATAAPFGDATSGFHNAMNGPQAARASEFAVGQPPHSLEAVSSEPSPGSGAHSVPTSQSPSSTNINSVTSIYSGWTDDRQSPSDTTPPKQPEDSFQNSVGVYQEDHFKAVSSGDLWPPNQVTSVQYQPAQSFYQQQDHSSHTLLSSPPTTRQSTTPQISEPATDQPFALPDEAFARRESSTSALTESMGAVGIRSATITGNGFKSPSQPSSLAARRQRPRPPNLGPAALNHRSASYSAGMPASTGAATQSLNPDHSLGLRRISSSGVGRIQKRTPGSAQRSPLNITFVDAGLAAPSPKFARQASGHGTPTSTSQGFSSMNSSLCPPTPLTPHEVSHFPPWQHGGTKTSTNLPDYSNANALDVSWSVSGPSPGMYTGALSNVASPPFTPLDATHFGHRSRLSDVSIYRDTPPQSAPATQQCFPRSVFQPPPQAVAVSQPFDDQSGMTGQISRMRRPSLPEAPPNFQSVPHYPIALPMVNQDTGLLEMACPTMQPQPDPAMNGFQNFHSYTLPQYSGRPTTSGAGQPTVTASDFFVHEYSPPQAAAISPPPRLQDSQRKQYIFANAGPGDFQGSAS